ncbi:hypothetical protein GBF38_021224, partial [Nibea albiflora]
MEGHEAPDWSGYYSEEVGHTNPLYRIYLFPDRKRFKCEKKMSPKSDGRKEQGGGGGGVSPSGDSIKPPGLLDSSSLPSSSQAASPPSLDLRGGVGVASDLKVSGSQLLSSLSLPPHSMAHESQLHLKGDPHYSFNHPFSIN